MLYTGAQLFITLAVPRIYETNWSALFYSQDPKTMNTVSENNDDDKHIAGDTSGAFVYDFSTKENGALSTEDWNIEYGTSINYNGEQQFYSDSQENLRIEDGALIIQANHSSDARRPYTSARINTKDKFSFTYGTLEVDMKLPRGTGSWPAAWLMPQNDIYDIEDYDVTSSDPYAWVLNGEIDFMEAIGSLPGQVIPATHSYNEYQRAPSYTPAYVDDMYDSYHRYGIVKRPGSIAFTIDGIPYATREKTDADIKEWPFEQPYYLILNLAVGGVWAGEKGIDSSSMPWQLKVRSIRYTP
jgi:beta-glucanase (GH16 family)